MKQRSLITDPDALRKRLLFVIERTPGITLDVLFRQFGIDKARLRRHVNQLPVVGFAEYSGRRGWEDHYYRWRWWCDCGSAALYRARFDVPGMPGEELELCGRCLALLLGEQPAALVSAIVHEVAK